jgi:hypothetical protein
MRAFILVAALAIASCATQPRITEPYDASRYQRWTVSHVTNSGTFPVEFHLRPHESNGKLALCGFYVESGHNMSALLLETHFADHRSGVFLNGQKVSSLAFLPGYNAIVPSSSRRAECIKSDVDWKPAFARPNARFTWPGGRVTR